MLNENTFHAYVLNRYKQKKEIYLNLKFNVNCSDRNPFYFSYAQYETENLTSFKHLQAV